MALLRVVSLLCICGWALGGGAGECTRWNICDPGKERCRDWAMARTAPESFIVEYHMDGLVKEDPHQSSAGVVKIRVIREWAQPFADKLYMQAQFRVAEGGPVYRAAANKTGGFVVQFGESGIPRIDDCWTKKLITNQTSRVHQPGNVEWTVAFGMSSTNDTSNPNCTSTDHCTQAFANEIFINLDDNTELLNPIDFSPVGYVMEESRQVVKRIYNGYGEVAELCMPPSPRPFCRFDANGKPLGVNTTLMNIKGRPYIDRNFPKITKITKIAIKQDAGVPSQRRSYQFIDSLASFK
mmetsp:Transcript_9083/g.14780  ORF Transcript_9083/g.14780 Transcript_9083/m.14780 type:complete len:296 (-) Transcript_9083:348-1235(-)